MIPRDINNVLSIAFGVLAVTILLAYSVRATSPYVVGENLVLAEIYLPGFYMKPITLFTYLFFLSYAFGLNSPISKARFLRMGEHAFEALYVLAWFFVMLSGFEVLYQIVLWSAGLSVQGMRSQVVDRPVRLHLLEIASILFCVADPLDKSVLLLFLSSSRCAVEAAPSGRIPADTDVRGRSGILVGSFLEPHAHTEEYAGCSRSGFRGFQVYIVALDRTALCDRQAASPSEPSHALCASSAGSRPKSMTWQISAPQASPRKLH